MTPNQEQRVFGIIPAGGVGTRMGLPFPKQLSQFRGKTILEHTVTILRNYVDEVVVVYPAAYRDSFLALSNLDCSWVEGGDTRFQSVKNGFDSLKILDENDLVLIHDAARPFLDTTTLPAAFDQARKHGALIYAAQATDTVKQSSDEVFVSKTINRNQIFLAQTPQIFKVGLLKECYATTIPNEENAPTDEAAMVEACGKEVYLFRSSMENRKLTHSEDLQLLNKGTQRIGHGYDVHRFDPQRPLFLCGIEIPGGPGLLGHSDADVALHALMDALLGALGLGDIGQHFPDNDPAFKGISSVKLLMQVLEECQARQTCISNVDLTILAQVPKLGPFRKEMKTSLCELLDLQETQVNVKFTTTEGLGYIGEKKGMAAHCVVLLQ